jgi:hypothetical protein
MVCTVDSDPESPLASCNASTCECSSWNYIKVNETIGDRTRLVAFWYCEVGPGWYDCNGNHATRMQVPLILLVEKRNEA